MQLDDVRRDPLYFLSRVILLSLGALTSAAGVVVFLLPFDIAPAGVSGLAVILNRVIHTPISFVIILANIPIQIVAFRVLNGWKSVVFTAYSVVVYSIAIDLLPALVPLNGITDDGFLNAVCGGLVSGVGGGLIYRAGGTVGGTSTIAQMLRQKFGIPLSSASLFGDTFILFLAGVALSWEAALYALIAIFISRITSDYVLEGPSNTCTALIITDKAGVVSESIRDNLGHDVTAWRVGGQGIHPEHTMILVSMLRSEIHTLKHIMRDVDGSALVSVLAGQVVYGDGFESLEPQMPLRLDEVDE